MIRSGLKMQKHVGRLLDGLHNSGKPRVWSIIITLFGDSIVPRGGVISLGSIQEIFSHMRFEENAVRTAMSRLTKEGWLERMKNGRQSFYKLGPLGVEQFESATRRIYACKAETWNQKLDLVIMKSPDAKSREKLKKQMLSLGFGSPTPNVFIKPSLNETVFPQEHMIAHVKCSSADEILLKSLIGESWQWDGLKAGYADILKTYKPVLDGVAKSDSIEGMDALVLRTLLIHDWRRLVLKDVELPGNLKPEKCAGDEARNVISKLYKNLLDMSEKQLDLCSCDMETFLPKPEKSFFSRFISS